MPPHQDSCFSYVVVATKKYVLVSVTKSVFPNTNAACNEKKQVFVFRNAAKCLTAPPKSKSTHPLVAQKVRAID